MHFTSSIIVGIFVGATLYAGRGGRDEGEVNRMVSSAKLYEVPDSLWVRLPEVDGTGTPDTFSSALPNW